MKIASLLLAAWGLVGAAAAPTLDEIVTKAIAASGGRAALEAVQAKRMTGKIMLEGAEPSQFLVELKRPGRIRTEVSFPNGTWVRAYDGKSGWKIDPFAPESGPTELSAEETLDAAEQSELDDPWLDLHAKGRHVEFIGPGRADGKEAWSIKVVRTNGRTQTVFFDARTFLKAQWEGSGTVDGEPVVFVSYFSDYQKVGALTLAHRIESGTKGGGNQVIVFDKIELNPTIPDDRFTMPAAKAAAR